MLYEILSCPSLIGLFMVMATEISHALCEICSSLILWQNKHRTHVYGNELVTHSSQSCVILTLCQVPGKVLCIY